MKKNSLRSTLVIFVILCLLSLVGVLLCKFYRHERSQSDRISTLQESVSLLSLRLSDYLTDVMDWPENRFNYLAIGNSLTIHGVTTFWWNEIGMAATEKEKDYYHIVSNQLEQRFGSICSFPKGFAVWETQSHDRDETLEFLDKYLSPEIDLITVQLGENASNLDTYKQDYSSLLSYLKISCPKARILVVGDFWTYQDRDNLKEQACAEVGVEYVSLKGIKDNKEYQCGLGTTVFDAEGNPHIVEHEGVARHPGDRGMAAIADRILQVVFSKPF